ncbi:MAG: FtsX-like permease family protein [Bacteroidota bacterium]
MSSIKRAIPFLHMAWRNTRRNTRRTLLTVSAVIVAVGAMIFGLSYLGGFMDNILDTYARTESGHVRLRQAGYMKKERSMPLHLNLDNLTEVLQVLRNAPHVEEALPRIRTAVLVDGAGSNKPGLLFGLDFEREGNYFNPTDMVVEGRLPAAGAAELMIGKGFAEKLEVALGDTLILLGQNAYRSMSGMRGVITAIGVSGLGHLDNRFIMTAIDQVQLMTDLPDATTEIVVFADDPLLADSLVADLKAAVAPVLSDDVEVLSWKTQGPLLLLLEKNKPISNAILFILMLMAGLVIVNTMLMTVMERTQELGMMAAMGMRNTDIIRLIVTEGAIIGLIGALIGGAISTAITLWFEFNGLDMTEAMGDIELPFQGIVYPDWTLGYLFTSIVLGVLAAGLAALYPAWRATRKRPAEALRK